MVYAGQVAQVEDVVELGRRRWKVTDNPGVKFQRGSGDQSRETLQFWKEKEGSSRIARIRWSVSACPGKDIEWGRILYVPLCLACNWSNIHVPLLKGPRWPYRMDE